VRAAPRRRCRRGGLTAHGSPVRYADCRIRSLAPSRRSPPSARRSPHAVGQTLYITEGIALLGTVTGRSSWPGQVAYTPPGEEHWHSAAPDAFMVHIALYKVTEDGGDGATWLERVTREQHKGPPRSPKQAERTHHQARSSHLWSGRRARRGPRGPQITHPADAVIRLVASCVCGRTCGPGCGTGPVTQPGPMSHEYTGVVEEIGDEVRTVSPGDFVVGRDDCGAVAGRVTAVPSGSTGLWPWVACRGTSCRCQPSPIALVCSGSLRTSWRTRISPSRDANAPLCSASRS